MDRASRSAVRALVIAPSLVTVGFGAWHFFVPSAWGWYAYIAPEAGELVIAVRALNFLFSLCLVMLGLGDLVLVLRRPREPFALGLLLAASTALWSARVALQLLWPQGTQVPGLAGVMQAVFAATGTAFAAALALHVREVRGGP